nr:sensor domain-containing diguanylate cyclase [Ancylobacter sp. Lp-2]
MVLEDGEGCWIDLDPAADPVLWSFAPTLVVRTTPGTVSVADTWQDAAFAELAAVTGAPGLRSMASVSVGAGGRLAVFDIRPRQLAVSDIDQLVDLANLAGEVLSLEQRARLAEERGADFRLLAETSTDTIVRGDLDGIRLYISPSVRTLLGYEPEELVGRRAAEIVHPEDRVGFAELMRSVRAGHLTVGVVEVRQRHRDGSWVWMEASLRLTYDRVTGEANGYVASVRGIDRRKQEEARLEHLASHDALTGLPNRALFDQHLAQVVARLRDGGPRFAVLYMDIDRFKQINDGFGHRAGDAVLREVAGRLRAALAPGDVVARLGGDEFAMVLMEDGAAADTAAVAGRLIAAFAEPFAFEGMPVTLGLSIGIALAPDCGEDPEPLVAGADRALYAAKLAGRNTFRLAAGIGTPAAPTS